MAEPVVVKNLVKGVWTEVVAPPSSGTKEIRFSASTRSLGGSRRRPDRSGPGHLLSGGVHEVTVLAEGEGLWVQNLHSFGCHVTVKVA